MADLLHRPSRRGQLAKHKLIHAAQQLTGLRIIRQNRWMWVKASLLHGHHGNPRN